MSFGAANPGKAYLAALMFGFFDALGYRLQEYNISSNLTSMIPYVITVIMMVYVVIRGQKKKAAVYICARCGTVWAGRPSGGAREGRGMPPCAS